MQTMTVRGVECLSAKDGIVGDILDFGKRIQCFQRYIETSDWDERLIRYAARFDRACFFVVILLAVAFFLSWSF